MGHEYADEMLAAIHEQLQTLNRLTGEQFEDNPMPPPQRVPRPEDLYQPDEEEDEEVFTEADILAFDRENFPDQQ